MSRPLSIALISETYPPEVNGVANTLGRLHAGLQQLGHRVQVVRPRQPGDDGRRSDAELVLTRGWPLPGYPGLQWGMSSLHAAALLEAPAPGRALHRHRRPARLLPCAARRLGIPAVSGFHTNFQQYSEHYGFGPLTRLVTGYLRWFHNRTQMTLVPSGSQRMELQRRGFERLNLLSRGVDSQLFHPSRRDPELRRRWGLGEQDIAVLHVGRLAAEKNLGLLGGTFRAFCAAHPQLKLRLVLVGDGPERKHLERDLPEALFCGVQRGETLAAHYASGDLFLFPSLSETFGNVVPKPRPPASRWSPSTRPPPASTSAMGTTACSPRRATRAASSKSPVGCWTTRNACAGSVSTPASTPAGKVGTASSSTSRTTWRTPAPVRWSSPLGRSPSGRRRRMAGLATQPRVGLRQRLSARR